MPKKVRRDTLGRIIPERDYAAIVNKTKELHGQDFYSRNGSLGGKHRTRGYFGSLKETDPEKFKELQRQATNKAAEKRSDKKS